MPLDKSSFNKFRATTPSDNAAKWARRRDIPIAILAWIALGMLIFWALGHVPRAIIIFAIAALLAYAITPGANWWPRVLRRGVAIISRDLVIRGTWALLLCF